jgi:surface antigen
MKTRLIPVVVAVALLGGCAQDAGTKQTGGAILGGIGGGLAGAQFGHGSGKLAVTALGTLLGAYLGSEAGKSLDRADQAYAARAEQHAYSAPLGQPIQWNNPETGHSGSYVATRDGTASDGSYCREYQTTVNVGGQSQQAYGTACRQPDGSWKVVR